MRTVLDKICTENKNILCIQHIFLENRVVYEVMSKSVLQPEGTRSYNMGLRVACWISKATRVRSPTHPHARAHTHTNKQICNFYCFSTPTIIRERVSVLRYSHIACLVIFSLH